MADYRLYDEHTWRTALQKYGAVTHLTVTLYDAGERIVCREPEAENPLFRLFQEFDFNPEILNDCARLCLAQTTHRPAVVVAPGYGLAVVGTSLVLDECVVGAAVAGYALVDFCQSTAIAALGLQAGVPFRRLWELAQQQQPLPPRRLVMYGELLQVLGDTILRENDRTRKYEETAARLKSEASVKDEFLAVLSHELRTPLTPILGWASMLERAGESAANRVNAAHSIKRNALLQLRMVDDLLDLNRVAHGKIALDIRVQDVAQLLASVLETVAATASEKGLELQFDEIGEALSVEGDAGRLQQIFANVIGNAIKFTPRGGRVRVAATRDGDTVVIRIADSGEGVSPQFLPHVFDMFRQQEAGTRRRHTGLGIGLALVKRFVEMHHGRVSIASGGAGRGTEVTIVLPLSQPVPGDLTTAGRDRPVHPFENLTILLVEDTEDTVEAMTAMLEALGAQVLVARNGLQALDVLRTSAPNLVLCDLRMPEMDGFEFLRELSRKRGRDRPPVIAVTGLVAAGDRERVRTAGFDGYLGKPVDDLALITTVRATLDHRRSA